jgi:branched-chain amino acid transport system substrate-binding protein
MRSLRTSLLLAAVLAPLAAACSAPGPVRLGVVMTPRGVAAARMAAADVNRGGGIGGRTLELVVLEEGGDGRARDAVAMADSLARDPDILGVVGHSTSGASLAAAQVYNAERLAHIAPAATSPRFRGAGPYSFRLVPDDVEQAAFLVRQAPGVRRAAIVRQNSDYGRSLSAEVRRRLGRAGVAIVYEAPVVARAEPAYFRSTARAVGEAKPDVLFFLAGWPELDPFVDPLRAEAPGVPVLASDGVDDPRTYAADPARYPGVRFVRFLDPRALEAERPGFARRYREATGSELSKSALAYDAVMLFAEALRAGALTREEVRAHLARTGRGRPAFRGVVGPVRFDSAGEVVRPYLLAEVTPAGIAAAAPAGDP